MASLFILHGDDHAELAKIIAPFVVHERFKRLRSHRQHLFFNRYEHLIHTASLCYRIAKLFRADVRVSVLSGLLHDFHETRIKGYLHGLDAAENALKAGMTDETVLQNVRAHMFPFGLGKVPVPKTREFVVLKTADFIAATVEVIYGFAHSAVRFSFRPSRIKFRTTHRLIAQIMDEIEPIATAAMVKKRA